MALRGIDNLKIESMLLLAPHGALYAIMVIHTRITTKVSTDPPESRKLYY